jgi:Uma2 family endonuclease
MPQHPTLDSPYIREQPLAMSYEDYLALPDHLHAEWVDGEVIIFMPPKPRHQDIVGFLYYLLSSFTDLLGLGKVLLAPLEMKLAHSSREPDILYIASEHRERLTEERLLGPADLVVELVSDDSVTRDRVTKFGEYEQAGVREYWLIDPRPVQQQARLYALSDAGTYATLEPDDAGRVHSAVLPGFWLRPAWLWQEPLPNPLLTLLSMQVLPPETLQSLFEAVQNQKEDE